MGPVLDRIRRKARFLRVWLQISMGQSVSIDDVCRYNLHDYPVCLGGDGTPSHFYEYTCWNCGEKFGI